MPAFRSAIRRCLLPLLRALIVLIALSQVAVHAQSRVIEVITLRYRIAEQVMPILKPLLDKAGTMRGMSAAGRSAYRVSRAQSSAARANFRATTVAYC
ncbi:MAG: hypothetical protein ABIS45_14755 [Burkholderiales bacterium]